MCRPTNRVPPTTRTRTAHLLTTDLLAAPYGPGSRPPVEPRTGAVRLRTPPIGTVGSFPFPPPYHGGAVEGGPRGTAPNPPGRPGRPGGLRRARGRRGPGRPQDACGRRHRRPPRRRRGARPRVARRHP